MDSKIKRNRIFLGIFITFIILLVATVFGFFNGFVSNYPLFLVFWIQGLVISILIAFLFGYKFIFKPWAEEMDKGTKK